MHFNLETFTGGFTMTNGFLLRAGSGRCVAVDAPEGMADWLDQNGHRIEALVLTHQHFDHVIDAAAIQERQACPLLAFSPPSADLTLQNLLADMGMPVEVAPYRIDRCLEGETSLSIDPFDFELIHVPGHSPDSLCFRPRGRSEREEAILLGGDVLFQLGIGRTDFPHSDHELLIQGIREKLLVLPDDTLVFPGHGPWTEIGVEKRQNPFLA